MIASAHQQGRELALRQPASARQGEGRCGGCWRRRRRSPCPPALPDYERWVFVDGRFAADLSAPAPDSCAALLNARDAGEEFSAMLDAGRHRHRRRGLRAGAREWRARRPGAAHRAARRRAGEYRIDVHRECGRQRRHFLSARPGARRTRRAPAHRRAPHERGRRRLHRQRRVRPGAARRCHHRPLPPAEPSPMPPAASTR